MNKWVSVVMLFLCIGMANACQNEKSTAQDKHVKSDNKPSTMNQKTAAKKKKASPCEILNSCDVKLQGFGLGDGK